jgi:hypothetical protein
MVSVEVGVDVNVGVVNVGVCVAGFLASFLIGVEVILAGDSDTMAVRVAATAVERSTGVSVGAPVFEDLEAFPGKLQAGRLIRTKAAMKRVIFFMFIIAPLQNDRICHCW